MHATGDSRRRNYSMRHFMIQIAQAIFRKSAKIPTENLNISIKGLECSTKNN